MANSRKKVPVIGTLMFFIMTLSCSVVKEHRDPCPCRLEIRLEGTLGAPATVLVSTAGDSWQLKAYSDTVMTLDVPREEVSVTAWTGVPSLEGFSIPEGYEAPQLRHFHTRFTARGELFSVNATLRKHYCTLKISVEGPPGWGEPFSTLVRGNVNGLSLTGAPLHGVFSCTPSPHGDGWTVRLPRQEHDSPLMLDIVMPDAILRTFSLGSYLQNASYDWYAPDLSDVELHMNLSVTSLDLVSPDWSHSVSLSVEI